MESELKLTGEKARSGNDNNKIYEEKRPHSHKGFKNNVHFAGCKPVSCTRTTQLVISYKEGKKVSKLREPRNLYELHHSRSSISVPRWPVEMKVLSDHPYHMEYYPPKPEIFYDPDPMNRSEFDTSVFTEVENGRMVYENSVVKTDYFNRSRPGGSSVIKTKHCSVIEDDDNVLHFESRFESGNLYKAVKIGPFDYQLWLRKDLYTEKYTQWYYFRVENTLADVDYRFTIMNLMKSSSLYSRGMKPLLYSEREAKEKKIGWQRVGKNIKYYKNALKREDRNGSLKSLYSLSWTVRFSYTGDRCYFAHSYPYTYTDLQVYLGDLGKDPERSYYCKQKVLTRSLAGNCVYVITITNPSKCPSVAKNKRAVIFTARVHPGESNSSWMMKGLIDYLTSDKQDAKLLRDTFIFKIIPMLNPDGVVVGNYRCSLSGRDLNRNYKSDFQDAFPSVWHTREMIKRIYKEREIILYCDLHGHSRQQNVFIYGCEDRKNICNGFKERIFPMMMSKNCQDKFCFKRCKFKVQKSKSGTGRIVMWNMGIQNSYTVEATFCGSTLGSKVGHHFSILDYELMGYHLCDTLLDYCDPDMSKYFLVLRELDLYVKNFILRRLKENGKASQDMDLSDIDIVCDYISESSTEGSDSSISDGPPMQYLYSKRHEKTATKKKKKRLKTRKERNKQVSKPPVISSQVKESDESVRKNNKNIRKSPTVFNELQSEQKKEVQVRPSHRIQSRSYQKHEHPKSLVVPRHLNDAKVRHYLESMKIESVPSKESDSLNVTTPQLRLTSNLLLGLAPATLSTTQNSSLSRWSVYNPYINNIKNQEEEEGSFIGRYLAKQINIGPGTKNGDGPAGGLLAQCENKKNISDAVGRLPDKYCLYHSSMARHNVNRKQLHFDEKETSTKFNVDHETSNIGDVGLDRNDKELNKIHLGLNREDEGSNWDHKGTDRNHEGSKGRHEGSNGDHEGSNTGHQGSNVDYDEIRRSQSMKISTGNKQNEKFAIGRRNTDSNLPRLFENGIVCKNGEKYFNFRTVPHYPINKKDLNHQKHDNSENHDSLFLANDHSSQEELVKNPPNVFPDLHVTTQLIKEESRMPRIT